MILPAFIVGASAPRGNADEGIGSVARLDRWVSYGLGVSLCSRPPARRSPTLFPYGTSRRDLWPQMATHSPRVGMWVTGLTTVPPSSHLCATQHKDKLGERRASTRRQLCSTAVRHRSGPEISFTSTRDYFQVENKPAIYLGQTKWWKDKVRLRRLNPQYIRSHWRAVTS